MCSPARCRNCGKTTWSGCGMHVEQVMNGVPAAQQCDCNGPAVAASVAEGGRTGGLRALFRR